MIRFISPPADALFRRLYSRRLRRRSVQAARQRSTSTWHPPRTAEQSRVPPLRNEPDHLALCLLLTCLLEPLSRRRDSGFNLQRLNRVRAAVEAPASDAAGGGAEEDDAEDEAGDGEAAAAAGEGARLGETDRAQRDGEDAQREPDPER